MVVCVRISTSLCIALSPSAVVCGAVIDFGRSTRRQTVMKTGQTDGRTDGETNMSLHKLAVCCHSLRASMLRSHITPCG